VVIVPSVTTARAPPVDDIALVVVAVADDTAVEEVVDVVVTLLPFDVD